MGMSEIEIRIRGAGSGRESAVNGLTSAGLRVTAIEDHTPVPHNGCRPPKRRRV
jgi:small subunit ribosomal protein S11